MNEKRGISRGLPLDHDFSQPFLIDHSLIRGRFVRLNDVVDTIISRHDYPEALSQILAELLVMTAMLASNLKHEGTLTIQLKGDGPVSFIVVDAIYGGELRGYAQLNEAVVFPEEGDLTLRDIMGEGYLAITLDQGEDSERYQGIVELEGQSVTQAFQRYFTQSQQVEVAITVAAEQRRHEGKMCWSAGGIMMERMPQDGGESHESYISRPEEMSDEELADQWLRIRMFMESVKSSELLDRSLSSQAVIYRLFNEDGVWAFEAKPFSVGCRCSRDRIFTILQGMPAEDVEHMKIDGIISVLCQFCNKEEKFTEMDMQG